MLQTEIFLQERFENPILSLSVYILYIRYFRPCSGRQSMASGSTVAGVHAGVVNGIAARRTLPRLLPSNISCAPLCGTRHRGLTSLAPVSALACSRSRSHGSSNVDLCKAMLKLRHVLRAPTCSGVLIVLPTYQTVGTLNISTSVFLLE